MSNSMELRTIAIPVHDRLEFMTLDEVTRWACLIEAVTYAQDKAEDLGYNVEEDIDVWCKPIAFQKYMNETHDGMKRRVEAEIAAGLF